MGQIESGKWVVALCIYFFVLFVVVWGCNNFPSSSSTAKFSDPGFGSTTQGNTIFGNVNSTTVSSSSPGYSDFYATLKVITGINQGSIDLGVPTLWAWIFRFLFVYIPLTLLLIALYFAMPFLH
jgi:hypothetical protein